MGGTVKKIFGGGSPSKPDTSAYEAQLEEQRKATEAAEAKAAAAEAKATEADARAKDQQQRLHLAVTQQEPLQGREGALAALGRVQVQPRTVLWQRLQERL